MVPQDEEVEAVEELQNAPTQEIRLEDQRGCYQRLSTLEAMIRNLEKASIEHRVRLENGTLVFSAVRSDIAAVQAEVKEVAKQVAPKPVDWWKIIVPMVGLLITLLTAWWALSTQLSQRPTADQVEKILQGHINSPGSHPAVSAEIRQLHDEQLKQSETLKGLTDKLEQIRQDVQDSKIDIRAMRGSRPSVPQQP